MRKAYKKGSRAERELINYFSAKGYSVIRAAGSGVNSLSPDLLAFRKGMHFAFESKAIEKENLNIDKEQFLNLLHWENNTGITCYIAWRRNRLPWVFIPLSVFSENEKSFGISWGKANAVGKRIEEF
ncbi:MAG: Holliday junction resolvase Hjc [Candidatus Bilamarchaeaceae archaeon]